MSSADIARGKEQLKHNVLNSLDSTAGLFENIQTQALLTGQVTNSVDLLAAIEAVKDADVNAVSNFFARMHFGRTHESNLMHFSIAIFQAAKKVAGGKWSIGAVGNLAYVPHATDL